MSLNADYVTVKDRIPRNGKGPDNLLAQLGQYLKEPENRFVQKIVVDATKQYIYVEKKVPKEKAVDQVGMTLHEAIRLVPMEEVSPDNGVTPTPMWWVVEAFKKVNNNGYETSHALVGGKSSVYPWLGVSRSSKHLFGVPLYIVGEIPDDVLIICGSRVRDADPEDIEYSVKVTSL